MDSNFRSPGAYSRTPGPLGLLRSAKPLTLRADTDTLSQLLTPGPIGHNPRNERVALEAFLRALLAMQMAARKGEAISGLPRTERGKIPDGEELRKDVAPLFNKMWAEIQKEFKARKDAAEGDSIRVKSGYRSAAEDNDAWYSIVPHKYLKATRAARLKTGEAFGLGPKSLRIMFNHMNGLKAPAGYSGHTHGIAVDLNTTDKGKKWITNSNYDHQVGWQGTWLYQWLVKNAGKHKFYQLKSETWHWEYHDGKVPPSCYGADVPIEPAGKGKASRQVRRK